MTQKITNEKTYRSVAFRGTPDRPKIRDLGDCQSRLGAGTKAWDKKLLAAIGCIMLKSSWLLPSLFLADVMAHLVLQTLKASFVSASL